MTDSQNQQKYPLLKDGEIRKVDCGEYQELEHQMKHLRKKQHNIYVEVWDEKDIIYTDQTGKFPHTSSRGYKYIMVMYYIDSSTILMERMKSREEKEMIRAHDVLINRLKKQGFAPIKQILDNEISTAYEKAIEAHGLSVKRVPKEEHRRNAAEKAIQIAKCNIKSVLAGCDDSFPMHLWDRLLPQIEIQMNLLRPANANHNVSAYQYVFGNHDYNRMPLHPLGCAVQVFNDMVTCISWEEQSKDGWYVGTSNKHYRTYDVWVKETRAVQNSDTVFFCHKYITQPTITKADIVTNAAN
jgi:hypothetical protein